MNPLTAFAEALNTGLEFVHRALEREAPVMPQNYDRGGCDLCMGEGRISAPGGEFYTCPQCNGQSTKEG